VTAVDFTGDMPSYIKLLLIKILLVCVDTNGDLTTLLIEMCTVFNSLHGL